MSNRKMMSMSPVVHSATAYLDFRPRLLARPDWFDDGLAKALLGAIRSAKGFPEGLRERERWLYYADDQIVVYGVIAMGRYFSGEMSHELVRQGDREVARRENDAFVGLAIQRPRQLAAPFTPLRDSNLLRDLYAETLGPRWREKRSPDWEKPTETTAREVVVGAAPGAPGAASPRDVQVVEFLPYSNDDAAWRRGVAEGRNVLLGLTSEDDARDALFSIVTAGDVKQRKERRFEPPRAAAPRPQPRAATEDSATATGTWPRGDLPPDDRRRPSGGAWPRDDGEDDAAGADRDFFLGRPANALAMAAAVALGLFALLLVIRRL